MKKHFDLYSRTNQLVLDGCVFALSVVTAYLIRFEGWPPRPVLAQLAIWLPILVFARLSVHWAIGAYRLVWRFVSLADALEIAKSIALVTAGLLALRILSPGHGSPGSWVQLPLSVIVLEGLLSLTGSLGMRALRRLQYTHQRRVIASAQQPPKRVLLYGAGRAGILLRKELENNSEYNVIGFVDDDPQKKGSVICGTRVFGNGRNLPFLVTDHRIDEIVISMATASRQTLGRIVAQCRQANLPAKIIPSMHEILTGNTRITELRDTKVEDLLGRDSVAVAQLEQTAGATYRGTRVLVTGAGGSIGSELVRQLAALGPERIAILDKDENSIYELEQELLQRKTQVAIEPQIADVRYRGRLRAIFSEFRPQIVFHAAAHKHVPLMEKHPCEAVLNNVCGTKNLLEVATEYGVERFVFISSDKAVNPYNVMGATKRIGELLVQASAGRSRMHLACVRFGNVMGSRGSVLPLFQKQIAQGGPITITHPDVTRYFMTIREAVQLILCAGTLASNGETFVLDMGVPRNIMQLAHEMILLHGLEPGKDIQTVIMGLRPGEKLFEEVVSPLERVRPTRFDKLMLIEPQLFSAGKFTQHLERLMDTATANDRYEVYRILTEMDLGFTPQVAWPRAAAASA